VIREESLSEGREGDEKTLLERNCLPILKVKAVISPIWRELV